MSNNLVQVDDQQLMARVFFGFPALQYLPLFVEANGDANRGQYSEQSFVMLCDSQTFTCIIYCTQKTCIHTSLGPGFSEKK